MFRLNQALHSGYTPFIDVSQAQADPTPWWRAFSAQYGRVPPVNPAVTGAAGLAQIAATPQAHRYSPAVRRNVTPRQAVMDRLVRGASRGTGYGGWVAP